MSDTNGAKADIESSRSSFSSALPQGRQRFLAHVLEHSLAIGRRTPQDFIRHFPPHAVMNGLEGQPALRANILEYCTGLKRKIAMKKSWQSAGEDLQIALDERETDAEAVVAAFDPDDRVRYLDDKKLWAFVIEGEFWSTPPKQKDKYDKAKAHTAYMLERALIDELVTHRDIVDGITVAQLALCLPKAELGKIIEGALNNAHRNTPFTEADLLISRPPSVIVEYVPLSHIYETVIDPKIARVHGYVAGADAPLGATADAPEGVSQRSGENEDWVDVGNAAEGAEEDEISEDDFASA
ncbi:MAG TPA: hypothetical protein VK524_18740 [Polyangiaceae bacterium]|nr:hypothetical protein [Polyangiaceae bacterium]